MAHKLKPGLSSYISFHYFLQVYSASTLKAQDLTDKHLQNLDNEAGLQRYFVLVSDTMY